MKGDRHKPQSSSSRWIEAFMDGMRRRTRKGKTRIPSLVGGKREARRWSRRVGREEVLRRASEEEDGK